MTSSPFLTLKGARSPLSRRLPSPTLSTLPRLGFSLAVSGRTMPLLVLDSASTRLTRILSPRGRSLGMILSPSKRCCWLLVTRYSLLVEVLGPAAFVEAPHHARQRVQEQVQVDGLGEHAEHVHSQSLVQQMVGQVLRQQNGGRSGLELAHELDDLEAAELGHLLIEDGDVDRLALEQVQRLAPAAHRDRAHALGLEELADGVVPSLGLVGEQDGQAVRWLRLRLDHERWRESP